jgi:hypothetical protein
MKVTVESQQDFKGTEFIFSVEGINTLINGRITEILDETKERPFSWQISHYYSPTGGGIHYPSARNGSTFDEAYQIMTGYLANMSEPLKENDSY